MNSIRLENPSCIVPTTQPRAFKSEETNPQVGVCSKISAFVRQLELGKPAHTSEINSFVEDLAVSSEQMDTETVEELHKLYRFAVLRNGSTDSLKKLERIMAPNVIQTLIFYGLKEKRVHQISQFCKTYQPLFNTLTRPAFYHRRVTGLSRSLVCVPEGPKQGIYVLLKTHGKAKELGNGSFNRATLAINFATGEKRVFRSARRRDVLVNELNALKRTLEYTDRFVSGIAVKYMGHWTSRADTDSEKEQKWVRKIGFIMDYLEGGDLFTQIYELEKELDYIEKLKIAIACTERLKDLHDLDLIHLDLKPENVFMTKQGDPLLGDFGLTVEKDKTIIGKKGTSGYIAPEIFSADFSQKKYIDAINTDAYCREHLETDWSEFKDPQQLVEHNRKLLADSSINIQLPEPIFFRATPAADVWAMGCILADLFYLPWTKKNGQHGEEGEENWGLMRSETDLEELKKRLWGDFEGDPLENLISSCLSFEPSNRPTVEQLRTELEKICCSKKTGLVT